MKCCPSTKKHPSSFEFGCPLHTSFFLNSRHDILDITVSGFTRARPDQETACIRELSCFLKYRWTLNSLQHNKQLYILIPIIRARSERKADLYERCLFADCIMSGRHRLPCQLHHSFLPTTLLHAVSRKLATARLKNRPLYCRVRVCGCFSHKAMTHVSF